MTPKIIPMGKTALNQRVDSLETRLSILQGKYDHIDAQLQSDNLTAEELAAIRQELLETETEVMEITESMLEVKELIYSDRVGSIPTEEEEREDSREENGD